MRGFTIIELLTAIAILVIVSAVGFISLSKYKGGQDVELSMEELVTVVRDVQKRSITERDGKTWGIRFSNASSAYEIWSGPTYASGTVDKLYSLGRNIVFGNPSTSTLDILFSAISGKLSNNQIISLVNKRRDGLVGDITFTSRGTITNRLEHGLVGYWHFDEGTGASIYDSSGFSNTGAATGTTWLSASSCRAGPCLDFDGVNDYINLPNAVEKSSAITVSAWINSTENDDFRPIMDRADTAGATSAGWRFDTRISGALRFRVHTTSGVVSPEGGNVRDGNWHHVAGTFDGKTVRVYVDGSEVASAALSGNIDYTGVTQLTIGSQVGGATNFFDAVIDEVRLYNRALTAAEISNLYNDLK